MEKSKPWGNFGEIENTSATILSSVTVPQKLRIQLLYNSVILNLSIYPKELKAAAQKIVCKLSVVASAYSLG